MVELGDAARPPAGLMCLAAGADRRMALSALAASVKATHSLGLIWIDSRAALEVPERAEAGITERSVLAQALGLDREAGAASAAAFAGECRAGRPARSQPRGKRKS